MTRASCVQTTRLGTRTGVGCLVAPVSRYFNASWPWSGAQNFANFAYGAGRTSYLPYLSWMGPADIMQIAEEAPNNQNVTHTTIVTYVTGSDIRVSYHTTDTRNLGHLLRQLQQLALLRTSNLRGNRTGWLQVNRRTALLVAAVCISLPVSGCAGEQGPDIGKRGDAVNATMKALHAADAEKLAALAGPAPADPADAAPLLAKWAGVSDQDYSASYQDGMGPDHVTATVDTEDRTGKPVHVEFNMSWHEGRWMLGIGHATSPSGASLPAQADK